MDPFGGWSNPKVVMLQGGVCARMGSNRHVVAESSLSMADKTEDGLWDLLDDP